jgi:hypothetical protein
MAYDPERYFNNDLSGVAHLTEEAVQRALDEFPLQSQQSYRWLTGSIRRAFLVTVSDKFEDYPGTVHVKNELMQISSALETVIEKLENRSEWAESVLRTKAAVAAYKNNEELGRIFSEGLSGREKSDPQYQRDAALHEDYLWWADTSLKMAKAIPEWKAVRQQMSGLYALRSYVETATDEFCAKDDPPRWRDMERRKRRISFAYWLSAVFEVAYQRQATVNNWTDEVGQPKRGPWPDFFNRIGCLAFRLDRIPDVQGILKEARRGYKLDREWIFAGDFPNETPP